MRVLAAWLLFAALSGCASRPVLPPLDAAGGTGTEAGAALPLLSPASLGQERQVQQQLRGEFGERTFSLRCVVSVDARQLQVIGVTAMGLRAFTLRYDGERLDEQRSPQVPDALQAASLLNDLQLVLWPLPALQRAWSAAGVEVSEPWPGTRRLLRAGRLLAEVHYATDGWEGRVWLRHFDRPYSLFIVGSRMGAEGG